MAVGLDDALTAAAAGVKLTDTIVKTIKSYRKQKKDIDIELLIEEVRVTALRRIDEADAALSQFERMLYERGIDCSGTMIDIVNSASWWNPFEQHRLKEIHRTFNQFSDSIYGATDDIAALLRCRNQTGEMGVSVVESAKEKEELSRALLNSPSLKASIHLLRNKLKEHKEALYA